MSITVISIFVFVLTLLIFMFIRSLFQVRKVDLLGRVDQEMLESILANKTYMASNSTFGKLYKRHFERRIGTYMEKSALLLGLNMTYLQEKIILCGKEEKISAIEILCMKIIGIAALPIIGIPAVISNKFIYVVMAFLIFMILYILPTDRINDSIKERERLIVYELPIFIEQLYMCMESGTNLKPALEIVSIKTGGILGKTIQSALALSIYSGSWEKELAEMCNKVNVEPLQNFINDLLIAFDKGISITETLRNEVKHINQIKRSRIREDIQNLQGKLFIPVMLFFLLPTASIVIVPIMLEASRALS